MIYYISIFIFSTFLIFGAFTPKKAFNGHQISTGLASLCHDYTNESTRVMAAIRAEFGVSEGVWDKYMDDFRQLVANDSLLGKTPVKITSTELIPRLLEEYGINRSRVRIKELDGKNQAEAFQDIKQNRIIHRLGVNNKWLQTLSLNKQEAVLRHEIQHLLNYDSIEEMYIRWILTDLGFTQDDWKKSPAMTDYYHLRELRADAFACRKSKKVAQSLHDFFCDTMYENEDTQVWDSHPRDSVRANQLALMHNLNSEFIKIA
ncbi:hypothetical protein BH09DEP1_BH09DEP1_0950 [soil metagenome]